MLQMRARTWSRRIKEIVVTRVLQLMFDVSNEMTIPRRFDNFLIMDIYLSFRRSRNTYERVIC